MSPDVDITLEKWKQIVGDCLGQEKNVSDECIQKFAMALMNGVGVCQQILAAFACDNGDIKNLRTQISELRQAAALIQKTRDRLVVFNTIESFAQDSIERRFGFKPDIDAVAAYADWLNLWTDLIYGTASKPGRKNGPALVLCYMVCKVYEAYLEEKPVTNESNFAAHSGDPADLNPYERVCFAVGELAKVQVKWSTCRQAAKSYRDGGFEVMKMVIDPEDIERMKSLEKLLGI